MHLSWGLVGAVRADVWYWTELCSSFLFCCESQRRWFIRVCWNVAKALHPLVNLTGKSNTRLLSTNCLHFVQCIERHWLCGWRFLTKMMPALEVVFHFVIPSSDSELLGDSSKGTILPRMNLLAEVLSVPRAKPEREMTMSSWRALWLGLLFLCPSCCQFALKCKTVLEGHGKFFTFKHHLSQSNTPPL